MWKSHRMFSKRVLRTSLSVLLQREDITVMSVRIVFPYSLPTDRNTWLPCVIWLDIIWSALESYFKGKLVTEVEYLTAEGTSITPDV